jgi:8-amino-7-oxononanoate synthase
MNLLEWAETELELIKKKHRWRNLSPPCGIDLSSNDYLGLSTHPILIQKFIEGIQTYGVGSTASRLIRGHRDIFEKAEEEFSNWIEGESALFLANGFLANLGLMDVLGSIPSKFFCDRLNHASILDGIRLSGAEVKYYKHRNYEDLENLLKRESYGTAKVIVSETVFSMDGDLADLVKLIELKKKYNACLVLDEAHALGVFGKQGEGLSKHVEINLNEIDFRVFTCGKALGLEGAFIVCSKKVKQLLINKLRTFIFSTAPIPAIAYAVCTAIELVKEMQEERKKIFYLSNFFREQLKFLGLDCLDSNSQIIPILTGDEANTMELATKLQTSGFDIRGIRPPTVKKSRLRVSINSKLNQTDLEKVIEILKSFSRPLI